MDIPTNGDELVDEAKKLAAIVAETELGQTILGDVLEKSKDMLDDVRELMLLSIKQKTSLEWILTKTETKECKRGVRIAYV
jgi:hypothetical protein